MKPDYKNWVPRGLLFLLGGMAIICLALCLVFGMAGVATEGGLRIALGVLFGAAFLLFAVLTGIFANMYCAFSYVNSLTVLEEVLVNHSHVAGCGFDIEFEFESHNVCRHLLCFKSVILGDIAVKIFTSHNADFAYVKAEVIVCVLPQWLQ